MSSSVLANRINKEAKEGVPLDEVVKLGMDDPHHDNKFKGNKKMNMHSEDFEANLGKVIDTLNKDYPVLFEKPPDFGIYIDDIEITDPTGKAFQGLPTYKSLWTFLRWSNKTVFKSTELKYRLHYDCVDQAVRIIWHVKIWADLPIF